jgi:hypothetical protein
LIQAFVRKKAVKRNNADAVALFISFNTNYSYFLPACNLKYSYCNPLTVTVDFPDDLLAIE